MPRKYFRRGTRGRWTDLQLQAALKAVRERGASININAARSLQCPRQHFSTTTQISCNTHSHNTRVNIFSYMGKKGHLI